MIDFRNTNSVWSSLLAETLKRLGLTTAIICPGSRSTPLAIAFSQQKNVEAISILDERSAAFFALGIAKKTGLPVAIICTSGTAGANFYPAIIEARESRVPLLILTADRPPELRDCHSGQTIDQVKLYGNYPNWQTELAVPSLEIEMLNYLRQTVIHAWERSHFPTPGPVHLNIPFRDPLAPIPQAAANQLKSQFQLEAFFAGIRDFGPPSPPILGGKSIPPKLGEKSVPPKIGGSGGPSDSPTNFPPKIGGSGGPSDSPTNFPPKIGGLGGPSDSPTTFPPKVGGLGGPSDSATNFPPKIGGSGGPSDSPTDFPPKIGGLGGPSDSATNFPPKIGGSGGLGGPIFPECQKCDRGIIIAGTAQPHFPKQYSQAISHLSQTLKWPVLAEGLSPLRNYAQLNPYLISTYDLIIRNQQLAEKLTPKMVIQIGELPTSKELRNWLNISQAQRWIIDPSHHNLDALHGKTTHLRISVEELAEIWQAEPNMISEYLQNWCNAETHIRQRIAEKMASINYLLESKAAWLISQNLPSGTPIFIANSMPVRDVEFFWQPNNLEIQPFFNRGANGIDGTLSTALGIAHRHQSSVILTGDLALLHDTNGFLLRNKLKGHLTIILINNNGGGIFEMLPIANFEPPFEEFFGTPQDIDFAQLCATYGVEYELIANWDDLKQRLNPLPDKGIRVLEVPTNRKTDAKWRKENLGQFAEGC